MIRKLVFLISLLIFLSGCTTAEIKKTVPPTTVVSSSESLSSSTTPTPAKGGVYIVISGTVKDISLSARVITLNESVNDFSMIALTEKSELASENGDEITLRDIQPGMTIQAAGQPGDSNTLLANQVLVLNSTPMPSNNPNEQQIDAINAVRAKLELPESSIKFIGMTAMENSPTMQLDVAQYQDPDGRKYSVDPRTNRVVEIDARSMLPNISPNAPLLSEEELEAKARKYVSATTPDFETLQVKLTYEKGNKGDMYFFSWYDETTTGFLMRPFAQVGLHKSGLLFAYYNTLLPEK